MAVQRKSHRRNYRLRITRFDGINANTTTYLVRRSGGVGYMTGTEAEVTLSSLVDDSAVELRFALEDAIDGEAAATALRRIIDKVWSEAAPKPRVELLPSAEHDEAGDPP